MAKKRWKPEEERYVVVLVDDMEKLPVEDVFVLEVDRYILQRYLDRGQTHVRAYTAGIYRWTYEPERAKDEQLIEIFIGDSKHDEPIGRTVQILDPKGALEEGVKMAKAEGYEVVAAIALY